MTSAIPRLARTRRPPVSGTRVRDRSRALGCIVRVVIPMLGRPAAKPVIVRDYGRDSMLVWANLLLAPIFARLGLRVGIQSEEKLRARIEADSTVMRRRGYFVASVPDLLAAGDRRGSAGRLLVSGHLRVGVASGPLMPGGHDSVAQ